MGNRVMRFFEFVGTLVIMAAPVVYAVAVLTLVFVVLTHEPVAPVPEYAEVDYSCADNLLYVDASPADLESLKHYANEACEYHHSLLLGDPKVRIAVMMVEFPVMQVACDVDPAPLACTTWIYDGETRSYIVIIPHGMTGLLAHELTHIIYLERGVPSSQHHEIMLRDKIYWPSR